MVTDRNLDVIFEEATSIYDLLFVKNPYNVEDNRPIFISGERTLTYGEVRNLVLKCGNNLQRRFNVQKGDVIAIRSFTHIEYPIVLHGTLCTGGTIALIKFSPEDDVDIIAQDLQTVKPKLFIIEEDASEMAIQAACKAGIPKSNILVLGDTDVKGISKVKDVLLSGDLLENPFIYTQDELKNMTSYLFFTSGSTGRRKAVKSTAKAMLITLSFFTSAIPNTYDRHLSNKPLSFVSSAFNDLHRSLLFGYKVFFSKSSTIGEICNDIEKFKINRLYLPPYVLIQMAKDKISDKYDLSSLESIVSIGSVLSRPTIQLIKKRFRTSIQNGYGASEFFGPFIYTPELSDLGAIGRLRPEYTVRLVDIYEKDVKPGEPGELLVKGPTVTKGYYNNSEATAKAFTKGGFFRSGDIFVCDENGVFWFQSRIKNLMKFKSTHIYPCDIEKVVLTHPKVSDCGVIGVYSEELSTDLPRAYITLVNKEDYVNQEQIAKEILEYANKQLHENKHIRDGLFIIKELPRTETGKIIYGDLREYALKGKTCSD